MPSSGLYFEPVYAALRICESVVDLNRRSADIESFDFPDYLDQTFEELAEGMRQTRRRQDYFYMGCSSAAHVLAASQILRGWDVFLLGLLERPVIPEALVDRLVHAYCERFDRYREAHGEYMDVVVVRDNLETQTAPIISPELYGKMIKPYQRCTRMGGIGLKSVKRSEEGSSSPADFGKMWGNSTRWLFPLKKGLG